VFYQYRISLDAFAGGLKMKSGMALWGSIVQYHVAGAELLIKSSRIVNEQENILYATCQLKPGRFMINPNKKWHQKHLNYVTSWPYKKKQVCKKRAWDASV
jgi:hypothetical protein